MEKITMVHRRRQLWETVLKRGEDFSRIPVLRWRGMPSTKQIVDEIYSNHFSEKEKTHVCSDTYVNCRPESSWEHLISWLYRAEEMTAVDQARSFLPPRGKWTTYKQHLMLTWGHMRHGMVWHMDIMIKTIHIELAVSDLNRRVLYSTGSTIAIVRFAIWPDKTKCNH